jgi:hypothetical protein
MLRWIEGNIFHLLSQVLYLLVVHLGHLVFSGFVVPLHLIRIKQSVLSTIL